MKSENPKKLELDFKKWGKVTATLLWVKAPETCAAIVETLRQEPVTAPLLHAQYAGSELYFEDFPTNREIPFENTTLRIDENLFNTNKHPGGPIVLLCLWGDRPSSDGRCRDRAQRLCHDR